MFPNISSYIPHYLSIWKNQLSFFVTCTSWCAKIFRITSTCRCSPSSRSSIVHTSMSQIVWIPIENISTSRNSVTPVFFLEFYISCYRHPFFIRNQVITITHTCTWTYCLILHYFNYWIFSQFTHNSFWSVIYLCVKICSSHCWIRCRSVRITHLIFRDTKSFLIHLRVSRNWNKSISTVSWRDFF